MKTHIDLDADLVEYVREKGGYKTKKEAVNAALRRMASRFAARELLAMKGQFDGKDGRPSWHYDEDYLRYLKQEEADPSPGTSRRDDPDEDPA